MGHGSARIARALGVRERPSARSSAATPAPSASSSATPSPSSTTPGGTSAPPPAPGSTAPRPPPPANAPSPGTGAPPPPSTTTCSTSPATAPGTAGNPPPAPAPPPTSPRPPAGTGGTADDQRPPGHPRPHPRHPRRAGTATATTAATTCTPTAPSASSATWPASTKAPGPSRLIPGRSLSQHDHPHPRRRQHRVRRVDIAADDKRYRVEMCTDCPDQSCPMPDPPPDARAFDQMADRMLQAAEAAPAATASQPGPIAGPARRRPGGRPVTPSRRKPAEPVRRPAATPLIPGPPGERDMPETAEPYDPRSTSGRAAPST